MAAAEAEGKELGGRESVCVKSTPLFPQHTPLENDEYAILACGPFYEGAQSVDNM